MANSNNGDRLDAVPGQKSTKYRLEAGAQVIGLIGARALESLASELRPIACQTCHDPLSGVADLSADAVLATLEVVLSAHHPSCRPSDLRMSRELVVGNPTAVVTAWVLPEQPPKGHRAGDVVVVVNPSCDQLIARQQGFLRRRWTNVTLDDLRPLGFQPAGSRGVNALHGVSARLNGDALTIAAKTEHTTANAAIIPDAVAATIDNTWVVSDLPPDVLDAFATSATVTIAVTMQILPTALAQDNIAGGLTNRTTMLGKVSLDTHDAPER